MFSRERWLPKRGKTLKKLTNPPTYTQRQHLQHYLLSVHRKFYISYRLQPLWGRNRATLSRALHISHICWQTVLPHPSHTHPVIALTSHSAEETSEIKIEYCLRHNLLILLAVTSAAQTEQMDPISSKIPLWQYVLLEIVSCSDTLTHERLSKNICVPLRSEMRDKYLLCRVNDAIPSWVLWM